MSIIKKVFKHLANNIDSIVRIIKVRMNPDKYILYKAARKIQSENNANFNWGDDINPIIIRILSKKIPLFLPRCFITRILKPECYLVVGSTFTFVRLDNVIVWGAGIINDRVVDKITTVPKRVCAVRGPLTRQKLMELGIECPEIYGDPALLFPMIYNPKIKEKKYKMGIIPHYIDADNPRVKRLLESEGSNLISVSGFDNWREFIDRILECEIIVSSSLHGLIVSEAYKVPAVWAEFGSYKEGWEFKFHDFYESLGKKDMDPVIVDESIDSERLMEYASSWKEGHIDLKALLEACPFYEKSDRGGAD